MTGPEHYRLAEQILNDSAEVAKTMQAGLADMSTAGAAMASGLLAGLAAKAQVHATLALVAAQAPTHAVSPADLSASVMDGWIAVLS